MIPNDRHTYTYIEEAGYSCDDCGAHGEHILDIEHYPTCEIGSSNKWQDYYNQTSPEEENRMDAEYAEYMKGNDNEPD
jgi:hypothetical protein